MQAEQIHLTLDWQNLKKGALGQRPPKQLGAGKFATWGELIIHVIKVIAVAYGALVVLWWFDLGWKAAVGYLYGVVFGMLALAWIVYPSIYARRMRVDMAMQNREPTEIIISASHIKMHNAHFDVTHQWSAISGIYEYKAGVSLWMGASQYIPLPDELLPSDMTRDEVLAVLLNWKRAA